MIDHFCMCLFFCIVPGIHPQGDTGWKIEVQMYVCNRSGHNLHCMSPNFYHLEITGLCWVFSNKAHYQKKNAEYSVSIFRCTCNIQYDMLVCLNWTEPSATVSRTRRGCVRQADHRHCLPSTLSPPACWGAPVNRTDAASCSGTISNLIEKRLLSD
jgi:hypothetical protein